MKFSFKILLCMMTVIALALGFSGYYFVNYVFETSLEREIGQSLDESSILGFALETAALNVPTNYSVLPDNTIDEIAANLEASGQQKRLLRISDERKQTLYVSDGFFADRQLLEETDAKVKSYHIARSGKKHYVHAVTAVNARNRVLYLETMRDVSEVFTERAMGFSLYRRVTLLMLLIGLLLMYVLTSFLTKPIRILTRATKQMAAGDYAYRANQVSQDELGELTMDFNAMAEALERNVGALEHEVEAKEEFMGAFAHELKTPLTAIIGYADTLRSHSMDEEKRMMAANYIYTEGKRLEVMSLRLLDIIVAGNRKVNLQRVAAQVIFDYLKEMFAGRTDVKMQFSFEAGIVCAEPNLIKTVLVNLIDNACKASEQGGGIEVEGRAKEDGYLFSVRDHGIGIPREEQQKIIKAFYMVDKSRARSQNGAGLGLALCAEILKIHDSELIIESEENQGSCFRFLLKDRASHGEPGLDRENGVFGS